jgi:hypothetical protein
MVDIYLTKVNSSFPNTRSSLASVWPTASPYLTRYFTPDAMD